MILPSVRVATVTGAWLKKRAKDIAARLIKTRGWGQVEVIDGYIIRASRAASQTSAIVIDPPSAVVTNLSRYYPVGRRDNYSSKVGVIDGPYDLQEIQSSDDYQVRFYSYGFDPQQPDIPGLPNPWRNSFPLKNRDNYYVKRDVVRFSALKRYPIMSDQLPIPTGATLFSGVHTHGPKTEATPGYWWNNQSMMALTGGYGLARIADMLPLMLSYQGDPPVSTAKGAVTIVVTPVVKNGPTSLSEGVVAWGESAVRFALIEAGENNGPSEQLWSRLWKPEDHSCSFFHNGPWLGKPDLPNYEAVIPPKAGNITAWEAWFESNSSGGSRPNWMDCMAVVWFNGRFVVTMRVAAFNGAYTPADGELDPVYRMAGGVAHMRFDIGLDGSFNASEKAYEIWNSPEQYEGMGFGNTPYGEWVAGVLDDEIARAVFPAALLATRSWLAEVTLCADVYRRDIRVIPAASGAWRCAYVIDPEADRLEFRITRVLEDGEEAVPVTYQVLFSEIECGIDSQRVINYDQVCRTAPLYYVIRACDPQFVVLSEHEIAFLAREPWRDRFAEPNNLLLVVFDLNTGLASVRSDTGLVEQWMDDHVLCPHLDCIQQVIYTEEGEIAMQGVLLATSRMSAVSRISRDGGATWQDYLTGHQFAEGYSAAAYFVGNPYGGGSTVGRAII